MGVLAIIKKDLGARIQELRKDKNGLSQERFALKIEMDCTYFASFESGRRSISIVNIKQSPTVSAFPSAIYLKEYSITVERG